jgi:hypothetical protein
LLLPCGLLGKGFRLVGYARFPMIGALVLCFLLCPILLKAQGYNLKLGPLAFDLTGEIGLSYDDNITASGTEPLQDFILRVGFSFDSRWEVTQLNTLNVRLGMGFQKYFTHSELDSSNNFLSVDPDTEIRFEILAGPITFTISDAISFSADPTDVRLPDEDTLGDLVAYSRWNNRFTIEGLWDVNARTRAQLAYTRTDEIPLEDEFTFLGRSTDAFSGQITRIFSEDVRAGPWGQVQQTRYSGDVQNDSRGASIGFFAT